MRVSVIVPVRNESASIREILAGLAYQDISPAEYEILVIDGRSDDDTAAIVRDFQRDIPNLVLLENPKRLASAGRNVGVQHARGDYVVIVDGHCQVREPRLLTRVLEAFESSGADCLGRPQPLKADRPTAFQRAVAAARSSWLGHNPDSHIYSDRAGFVSADNVAVAYRRQVFDRVGLFDESFDACEDVEFNTRVRRAGLTCYFTPAIAVAYQPRATLTGLMYQMMRYGRGRARLARKSPATITGPSLLPPLWLIGLATASIVSLFSPALAMVSAATVAAYLAVILVESARVSWMQSHVSAWRLPLVFAAIHAGFGWGYLRETLAGLSTRPIRLGRWIATALRK